MMCFILIKVAAKHPPHFYDDLQPLNLFSIINKKSRINTNLFVFQYHEELSTPQRHLLLV